MRFLRTLAFLAALVTPAWSFSGFFSPSLMFLPGVTPGGDATIAFASNAENVNNLTTYTFTAQGIGVATANRVVIVAPSGESTGAQRTLTSVTLDGTPAVQQVNQTTNDGANNSIISAIFSLAVSTGATANIVLTFSGTMERAAIGVWATTGLLSATATATAVNSAITSQASLGASLTTQAGGVAVGAVQANINGGGTMGAITWTNMTGNYDVSFDGSNVRHGGSSNATAPGSTQTKTANFAATTPNRSSLALAAFR